MCSMYWNLRVPEMKCPACGEVNTFELQTHFMGKVGSSSNYYDLGEPVAELEGFTGILDGTNDDFIDSCGTCLAWIDFGAVIENGRVVRVWPLRFEPPAPGDRREPAMSLAALRAGGDGGEGVSKGQHRQANKHGKYSTRGERNLAKLGLRARAIGLRRLAKELGVPPKSAAERSAPSRSRE